MPSISNGLRRERSNWRGAPRRPAVLLILAQLLSGMRDMPLGAFFLIYLQEQLGQAPAAISSVVAGAQLAGMLTALLGGAVAARLGSKWVLAGGLALSGLGSLVFQSRELWLAAALWLVSGAGASLGTVGGASYLTGLSARRAQGILSALFVLSLTAGGAIGNPIAALLIERASFSAFGWAALALTAVLVLVVALLPPQAARATAEPARSAWRHGLQAIRSPRTRLLIGLRALPTFFYGMLTVLIPLLINELSGSKVTVAAYGTATLIVASAAQLLAGRAADRWGARGPTQIAYAVLVAAGLGLAASAGTVEGLFVFGVLGNAAAWSLSVLMYVWVSDGVPKPDHPATFGLLHAVWSLSMISGSLLAGWAVRLAPGLPFLAGGLLNIAAIFLVYRYYAAGRVEAGE